MGKIHLLAPVLMATKDWFVMVSLLYLSQFYNDVYVTKVSVNISLCHIFLLVLEINPACAGVNCPNGGSCIHINETNNNVCVCNLNSLESLVKVSYLHMAILPTNQIEFNSILNMHLGNTQMKYLKISAFQRESVELLQSHQLSFLERGL